MQEKLEKSTTSQLEIFNPVFLRSRGRCQIARLFIYFLLETLQKTIFTQKRILPVSCLLNRGPMEIQNDAKSIPID